MNSTTEWVTVPREPTEEMVAAGRRYAVPATQAIIPIYVAMISAAPVPPSPPREEIVEVLGAMLRLVDDELIVDTCRQVSDPNCLSCKSIPTADRARSLLSRLKEMEEGK